MRFHYSRKEGRESARFSLETIPFVPPQHGRLLENYLVSFSLAVPNGAAYSSSFTVYIYELDGRGLYLVKEPYLEPAAASVVETAVENLATWLAPSPIMAIDPVGYLLVELKRAGYLSNGSVDESVKAATYYLLRDILGYGVIDPLIRDPEIEDLSCEGAGRAVKIWHRKVNATGWLESNVTLIESERLDSVVTRLVHRSNRSVSIVSPVVDAVLPEGYRLTATWGREVTSLGSSFSIRKQRAKPHTITELIKLGTLDARIASYLWTLLELKGFVVLAGVPASGKTTLLNSLASVLNPNWKILSIEDTREISLPQTGWKPLHSRHSLEGSNVTLFDLVKLSLRERPDFVILGEARGEEVQVLFQSAASGSGCLTTFHASNFEAITARLTQPPLNVARSSLELIDAIVFMARDRGGARYIREVVEPEKEPRTVFAHDSGKWEGLQENSEKLWKRGLGYGYSPNRLRQELERRASFLENAVGIGVSTQEVLERELRRFYFPSSLTF